jgi:general secretion pathway protein A
MSIYLQYFGLKREPFSIVPDPGFLYPSHQHRQAVAHLKYGLDREGGFILLTGEVGTGKTTLTRTMLQCIPAHVRVAYVLNSKLNESDLLASICSELSIKIPTRKNVSFSKICIDMLNKDLLEAHAAGKRTLIVLEEAQNLSYDVLETLRLLSNLETNTHKLLHILLVGQPELLEALGQDKLRQLNQRVVSRFHLLPLDKAEIANYVNHRLYHAGAAGPVFHPNCVNTLYELTKGVPRLINLISHQALLAAYSVGTKTVSPRLVKLASKEILTDLSPANGGSKAWLATGFLVLAIAITLVLVPTKGVNWTSRLNSVNNSSENFNDAPIKEINRQNDAVELQVPVIGLSVIREIPEKTLLVGNESMQRDDDIARSATKIDANVPIESADNKGSRAAQKASYSKNPLINLLKRWRVSALEVYTLKELDERAERSGLRSVQVDKTTLSGVLEINRPGVVFLREQFELQKSALVVQIDESTVSLVSRGEIIVMDQQTFLDKWTGSYLYLWRSPSSFQILKPGDVNKPALAWLQSKLGVVNSDIDALITGGNYTRALQQQVTDFQRVQTLIADGIVGRQTVMRLNQLTDPLLPTLTGDVI